MIDTKQLHMEMMKDIAYKELLRKELLMMPLMDEDGFPTEACLEIIRKWHWSDSKGWFDFIKSQWWAGDWGWHEDDVPHEFKKDVTVHRYKISTGGWSGNESIIKAMEDTGMMWTLMWVQSRRGGHYIFEDKEFDLKDQSAA